MSEFIKITLVRSFHGRGKTHQSCIRGLGLTGKMHQSRIVKRTPENMGMVNKVSYLLAIEEVVEQ